MPAPRAARCLDAVFACGQQDQKRSDAVLDDVSCMLGCTRSSLNGAFGGSVGAVGAQT
jgi:DNA topoisomerase VI subunit A